MNTKRITLRKRLLSRASAVTLLVATAMVLTSCSDFLTENPKGSLSGPVLETKSGVDALLVGAYKGLNPSGCGWDGGTVTCESIWMTAADNWVWGSVMAGEAKKGSDSGDQNPINPLQQGFTDPTNPYINAQWGVKYEAIARTNGVLKVLPNVPEGELTQAERDNIEGQARFLRGHHYFELRRQFLMVPWIDETTEGYDIPNDTDIWPKVEEDFKIAFDKLPETQSEKARANKWAAAAYLAKTYLYQGKWAQAKEWFDKVITQGKTSNGLPYGLAAKYHDLFLPATQYNEENVFSVEYTGEDGTTSGIWNSRNGSMLNYPYNSPFRCCGFYQPSQDLVNSFKTQSGLPLLDSYNTGMVTSDQGVASDKPFSTYAGKLDPRLDWTVGRRGLPFLDWGPHPGAKWIRDQVYAGPYATKKHVYMKAHPEDVNEASWAPGSAVNYHIIRFADVLLMAAEAEAQLGNTGKALDYVNRVRRRAANPAGFVTNKDNEAYAKAVVANEAEMLASEASVGDWVVRTDRNSTFVLIGSATGGATNLANWQEYTAPEANYEVKEYTAADFSSKDEALKRIYFERKLELATEGHRLFDLFRWGNTANFNVAGYMNNYFNYEGKLTTDVMGATWQLKGNYFPIPQRQIDISLGKLKQNTGY